MKKRTIPFRWSVKHKEYMARSKDSARNVAEGSIRSGKTTDNTYVFAYFLKRTKDKLHLVTASTQPTAKLIVGDGDGFGLEHIFRGQCKWGKYKGNECLHINGVDTGYQDRIVIFCGGAKADSYKKFRGFTFGLWLATEINLHHEETIREALKRQVKAHTKKLFWDLNPENPNDYIYREYIDKWKEQHENGTLVGGYNYESFNIFDNINIPKRNLEEFISQYTVGSVYYKRDILGIRAIAEGLIYQVLANNTEKYMINFEDVPKSLNSVEMGLDFGKSTSKHALVTCGQDDKGNIYVMRARTKSASGEGVETLFKWVQEECLLTRAMIPQTQRLYADAAEPALINSLKPYASIPCYWSKKMTIKSRIFIVCYLLEQSKIFFVRGQTEELIQALCSAVYTEKNGKEERLDDGSYSVDIIDGFEYSIMSKIEKIARQLRYKVVEE